MINLDGMNEAELQILINQASVAKSNLTANREKAERLEKEVKIQEANDRLSAIHTEMAKLFKEIDKICSQFEYGDGVEFYINAPNDISIQYVAGDGWYSSY